MVGGSLCTKVTLIRGKICGEIVTIEALNYRGDQHDCPCVLY